MFPIKIISIAGARPQFVKTGMMNVALSRYKQVQHMIVHTGQHYDTDMSDTFFHDLQIPPAAYNFGINRLSHGAMTGRMLEKTEEVLIQEKPAMVIVYGDTNSTLAGALAARKLHIPVAHIESGLRSYDMNMPEEINRILTDRISNLLFCPTEKAVRNLDAEGFWHFPCEVHMAGDIMLDAAIHFSSIPQAMQVFPESFVLSTIHREETLLSAEKLTRIIESLNQLHQQIPVLFPAHPRTRAAITALGIPVSFRLLPPYGYLHMLQAVKQCCCVVTDSGGLQKEAYFFKKPCITARNNTEWTELTDAGVNILWNEEGPDLITLYATLMHSTPDFEQYLYGTGNSCDTIIEKMLLFIERQNL